MKLSTSKIIYKKNVGLIYKKLSLVQLVKEIVINGNFDALVEFHNNRTIFRYKDSGPLLFTEYINVIKENNITKKRFGDYPVEVDDFAFNLVVDKFSNLPNSTGPVIGSNGKINNLKHEGPDCRNYFRGFLFIEKQESKNMPITNPLEKEERSAKLMQGLINRHISLSFSEALRRTNYFQSRYNFRDKESIITVWLPKSIKGRDRKEWLRENIKDIDPEKPGERHRIQDEINKLIVKEKMVTINDATLTSDLDVPPFFDDSQKIFRYSLANQVAMRKVMNIHHQRPSIKRIGKEKLKSLILRIFDDLGHAEETDTHLAKEFGISKASLSRFAGKNWNQNIGTGKNVNIPDLWRNTAKALKNNEEFMETVLASGYAIPLEKIIDLIDLSHQRGTSNV